MGSLTRWGSKVHIYDSYCVSEIRCPYNMHSKKVIVHPPTNVPSWGSAEQRRESLYIYQCDIIMTYTNKNVIEYLSMWCSCKVHWQESHWLSSYVMFLLITQTRKSLYIFLCDVLAKCTDKENHCVYSY